MNFCCLSSQNFSLKCFLFWIKHDKKPRCIKKLNQAKLCRASVKMFSMAFRLGFCLGFYIGISAFPWRMSNENVCSPISNSLAVRMKTAESSLGFSGTLPGGTRRTFNKPRELFIFIPRSDERLPLVFCSMLVQKFIRRINHATMSAPALPTHSLIYGWFSLKISLAF